MTCCESVRTSQAPRPNGHYSQAVVYQGQVFLSMQLPLSPEDGSLSEGLEAQVERVISNCNAILIAAGSGLSQVLSVTIYLAEVADWNHVDALFARRFGEHRPARGVVPVSALHLGAKVGMQMIGYVTDADTPRKAAGSRRKPSGRQSGPHSPGLTPPGA